MVGEDADALEDGDNTLVIRNIKRWALSNDPYVQWRLEISETGWPVWWNPDLGCVRGLGGSISRRGPHSRGVEEAVDRAGLGRAVRMARWVPGAVGLRLPVHALGVLAGLAGQGRLEWVVDEPVLFLAAAQRNIDPDSDLKLQGSYLVYDLGGGSFDCALVDIGEDGEMIVFGADGDPLLGGSNVDRELAASLEYEGPQNLLRLAKEQVGPENPTVQVSGNLALSWAEVEKNSSPATSSSGP